MEQELKNVENVECGKEAAKYFAFDKNWNNLNHGSFGTFPTVIRSVLRYYQERTEARPDEFIFFKYQEYLRTSRQALATYMNAPDETIVLMSNATTGINTVLRNLVYQPNDVIVYLPNIYGSCEKTIIYMTETTPVERKRIDYTLPISDDDMCSKFEETIRELRANGKNPRLAVYDTITSMPGTRFPFERFTQICAREGVLSCIDGAHGVGHIPLDLTALDPDFFFSNCHKWLDVPRGCAVFYVPLRNQKLMRSTLPTSHGFIPLPTPDGKPINNPLPRSNYNDSEFLNNFNFIGTLDNAPFMCVASAIEWRNKITWQGKRGDAAHNGYCNEMARRVGPLVASVLGTEVLSNASLNSSGRDTLGDCNFTNVRLPLDPQALTGGDTAAVASVSNWFSKTCVKDYNTYFKEILYGGAWWVRLSAQIYLTDEDFVLGADILKKVCDRINAGEWKE